MPHLYVVNEHWKDEKGVGFRKEGGTLVYDGVIKPLDGYHIVFQTESPQGDTVYRVGGVISVGGIYADAGIECIEAGVLDSQEDIVFQSPLKAKRMRSEHGKIEIFGQLEADEVFTDKSFSADSLEIGVSLNANRIRIESGGVRGEGVLVATHEIVIEGNVEAFSIQAGGNIYIGDANDVDDSNVSVRALIVSESGKIVVYGNIISGGRIEGQVKIEGSVRIEGGVITGNVHLMNEATVDGNPSIRGHVVIKERARITDAATVEGESIVGGDAIVADNAKVMASATVLGGLVHGRAIVSDNVVLRGNIRIGGDSLLLGLSGEPLRIDGKHPTDPIVVSGRTEIRAGGAIESAGEGSPWMVDAVLRGSGLRLASAGRYGSASDMTPFFEGVEAPVGR